MENKTMDHDELQIDHDDDVTSVMEVINEMLKPHGIQFVDDEQEHDGFVIYTMTVDKKES
jgi:hypothetical protein